jgi:hypothetical protein
MCDDLRSVTVHAARFGLRHAAPRPVLFFPAMPRAPRRLLTLLVIIAWVVLGPVGMAFDACAAMMALCDGGSCGVLSAVLVSVPGLVPLAPLAVTAVSLAGRSPAGAASALDPPPKPGFLSA